MSMATKIKPIVGVALLLIMTCTVNWISRDVGHIVIQDIDYKVKQMSNKHWEEYTVYRNVCIDVDDAHRAGRQKLIRLTAYDTLQPATQTAYQIEPNDKVKRRNSQWVVTNTHSAAPETLNFSKEIAVFSGYWWSWGNIYKVLYYLTPMAYEASGFVDEHFGNTELRHLPKTHVIPDNTNSVHWPLLASSLGYDSFRHAIKMALQPVPQCFEYAVIQNIVTNVHVTLGIGADRRTTGALQAVNDYLEVSTKHQCTSKYALFIQRSKTRHLLNIQDLVERAKSKGYSDVRVVHFENKTFAEQWALVRCAQLYVGVHGAALIWFTYLPVEATFVEIVFDGWHPMDSDYSRRYRRDVTTLVFHCDRVTPDAIWKKYARLWFNYDGEITEHWKEKLNERATQVKQQVRYSNTPWKDSDVRCPTRGFLQPPNPLTSLFGI